MIEAADSPALEAWRNVAFTRTEVSQTPQRLDVYQHDDFTIRSKVLISREPATAMYPGPNMDELDVLIISMSKRDLKTEQPLTPDDSELLLHITNLLGEVFAAASIERSGISTSGEASYRLIFVDRNSLPVFAQLVDSVAEEYRPLDV